MQYSIPKKIIKICKLGEPRPKKKCAHVIPGDTSARLTHRAAIAKLDDFSFFCRSSRPSRRACAPPAANVINAHTRLLYNISYTRTGAKYLALR